MFPLIVQEELMIEPTETESKESLDPSFTPVKRLDEVLAEKKPVVRWLGDEK